MEDVGGEKGRFPANVGDGFLHILLNEPSPIDWLSSGHCSKHGVRHGYAKLFRLLKTKDGHNEFDHPPLPGLPTIPKVKPVLKVVLSPEFPYIQTILAASPSFALSWSELVNLSPHFGRPPLRILPNGSKPLVSPLE